jgi:hypothetical protein
MISFVKVNRLGVKTMKIEFTISAEDKMILEEIHGTLHGARGKLIPLFSTAKLVFECGLLHKKMLTPLCGCGQPCESGALACNGCIQAASYD